ncbi:MAG: RsmB/NOP family class I SAM-dependent RNA methyltransferase [Alphaproteobacteria bacterium]|nr:MAG: RsmB/NOP family class I SAM-dependent RNA methyltransferase [Alphaproteobacteria bacterium]
MTPSARAQAAIELLDEVITAAREGGAAADTLIARYFKTRRYAGSKDRREVRDLVFGAIRRAGERPASGRAAMLGLAQDLPWLLDAFDGSAHGPASPAPDEAAAPAGVAPAWIVPQFDPAIAPGELAALLARAPLDLRVNRLKGSREDALAQIAEGEPSPLSPIGIRLPEGLRIEDSEAWRGGLIEVQDEGSQLICLGCEAGPGMLAVDLCAGAGGKTLAIAAEMGNAGRIVASDADRGRLARMGPRIERAGVTIVEPLLLDPNREEAMLADLAGQADLVLVDAPCSGTGTWRRNPETRWRLTPQRLERVVALQSRLLDLGATLLKPGGRLVYAVCSLLASEGRDQAAALTARSSLVPERMPIKAGTPSGTGLLLSPARDRTDGFFVARWRRPC